MRYDRRVASAVVAMALTATLACNETGPDQGPPVDAELQCGDPGAPPTACTLPLPEKAKFVVTLVSTSCEAQGNKVLLISPEVAELTDDACDEPAGKTWTFNGPYPAGTELNFRIESFQQPSPPRFLASGAYPNWSLTFEDGFDTDFNDIVLQVTATAVP